MVNEALAVFLCVYIQWRRQEVSFEGYSPEGSGPMRPRGEVPQKLKQFADIVYRF